MFAIYQLFFFVINSAELGEQRGNVSIYQLLFSIYSEEIGARGAETFSMSILIFYDRRALRGKMFNI